MHDIVPTSHNDICKTTAFQSSRNWLQTARVCDEIAALFYIYLVRPILISSSNTVIIFSCIRLSQQRTLVEPVFTGGPFPLASQWGLNASILQNIRNTSPAFPTARRTLSRGQDRRHTAVHAGRWQIWQRACHRRPAETSGFRPDVTHAAVSTGNTFADSMDTFPRHFLHIRHRLGSRLCSRACFDGYEHVVAGGDGVTSEKHFPMLPTCLRALPDESMSILCRFPAGKAPSENRALRELEKQAQHQL